MVSKCANPDCNTRFRYLRSGKLFRFEVGVKTTAPAKGKKSPHKLEHFWLCQECASLMTLKYTDEEGLIVVPLHPRKQRASA
jgi:hypothetical protein